MRNEIELNETLQAVEAVLYKWACGDVTARNVRDTLKSLDVRLVDRLNGRGNVLDVEADGRVFTLSI